jgi:hypothetical protein
MSRPSLRELVRFRNYADAKRRFRQYSEAKALPLTGDVGWQTIGVSGPGLLIEEQTDAKLAAIYSKSDIVFACVLELQGAVPEAPLEVGCFNDEDEFEPAVDHDALSLFYENRLYSYADLLKIMVGRVALTGASFTHLGHVNPRFGHKTIVPIPTAGVGYKSKGPEITEFSIKTTAPEPIKVPAEEMCWHMILNPAKYIGYVSPLNAAMKHYSLESDRLSLTADILKNRNIPPGFFVPKEMNPTDKQRQQFVESYEAKYGKDSGRRSGIPMLPKGVDFVKGAEFTDIDFSALAAMSETRICMVLRVSPILIAAKAGLDSSTYANYASARQSFYKETISDWWTFLQAGFTRAIFGDQSRERRKFCFRFDRSGIPELQADKLKEAQRASILYKSGVVKRRVAQQIAGVEIEEDETLANEYAVKPGPALPPPAKKPELLDYKGRMFAKVDYRVSAVGDFESATLHGALDRAVRKQQTAMLRETARGKTPMLTPKHDEQLKSAIRPAMTRIWERAAKDTLEGIAGKSGGIDALEMKAGEIGGGFNVVRPELAAQMEKQLTQLAEEINGTTNRELEKAIKKAGRAAGASGAITTREKITRAVRRIFKDLADYRILRIAKTEWSRAQHDSQILAAANTGIVQGMKTVISKDACEICQVYDEAGEPTGVPKRGYQSMTEALNGVGDYGSNAPPFHPNCRCTQVPVLIGEDIPEYGERQTGRNVSVGETSEDV